MKQLNTFLKIILFIGLPSYLIGCSKDSSGQSETTTSTTYYWSGSYCYSSSTNQTVNTSYCSSTNTANSLFAYSGNNCIYITTGQTANSAYCGSDAFSYTNSQCIDNVQGNVVVDNQFCSKLISSTISTTTTTNTYSCYGTYYYYYYYTFMPVVCYGYNCSGYTLYSSTGQMTLCQ